MRRRFVVGVFLATFLVVAPAPRAYTLAGVAAADSGTLARFPTEAAAQRHCPNDEVVWLNIPTHIYHEKGMRWYGRTKNGAYVCRKEADAAGDRDTRNGQ